MVVPVASRQLLQIENDEVDILDKQYSREIRG
jgi:hypothetical protein